MKKYLMLGVNSNNSKCCKLSCLLPFDSLVLDELETSDFVHDATNWGGCDMINRTIGIIKMNPTGRKHLLAKPLRFHGSDYDCGTTSPWSFAVDEIWELE